MGLYGACLSGVFVGVKCMNIIMWALKATVLLVIVSCISETECWGQWGRSATAAIHYTWL